MIPNVPVVAFMVNPTDPRAKINTSELQAAARIAGQQIVILNVSHEREFEAAFARLLQSKAGALLIDGDILFNDQRDRLIEFASRHRVPASYQVRESAVAGGLMSYGQQSHGSVVCLARVRALGLGQMASGRRRRELEAAARPGTAGYRHRRSAGSPRLRSGWRGAAGAANGSPEGRYAAGHSILAGKFTSAKLYGSMSKVLDGVYQVLPPAGHRHGQD